MRFFVDSAVTVSTLGLALMNRRKSSQLSARTPSGLSRALRNASCRMNPSLARGEARPHGVAMVLRVTGALSMHKQAIFGIALLAMILMPQAPVALAQDNRLQ